MPFPGITRAALVERLLRGHAERLTVLTPNRRLADWLVAQADAIHVAAGQASWEAPDVLAFPDFVRRCYDEAARAEGGADLPVVLEDPASRLLWEDAIRASRWGRELVSLPSTAALAAEAWALAHGWRIEGALRGEARGEDAEAFIEWAEDYVRRTARDGFSEAARMPALVAAHLGAIQLPRDLVLYAFDLLTPQQRDFVEALERAGVTVHVSEDPTPPGAVAVRVEVQAPRDELEHAARWARARLEASKGARLPRIGIVIPDLAQRRREAARIFSRTFAPAGVAPGERRAPLFNLSLGEPLSQYPLVDAALALLELAAAPFDFDRASRLIRSPFIADAEGELGDRARLDAALRRMAPASLTLNRLRTAISQAVRREHAPECPRLLGLLDRVADAARGPPRAAPHDWAKRFSEILRAAGFPGERTLDSDEYQTLEKWRDALSDLAALGLVAGPWSGAEARSRLQRTCTETLFQPRSGAAPVQVLGLLESAGLDFDHLWICGLTEDKWPISARPHPLIAPSLQRKAGIPQASPEQALEIDRRITAGWRLAAREVVFSTARTDADRELLPSPLIADLAATDVAKLAIPRYAQLRTALFKAGGRKAMSYPHDDSGPGVASPAVKGGSRILVDQAACPFRSFAHFRLDAHELERPEHGLGPLERGTLLHEMMGRIWEVLKDQATLKETGTAALEALALEAASYAIQQVALDRPGRLDGKFAELEQKRLVQVAIEWLDLEARRTTPFTVTLREKEMKLEAGPLQLDGRIDRVDHLETGGISVFDYKSGRVSIASWLGEPPDDAQLPLYALTLGVDDVRAVAFARLKTGDRGFAGLAKDADTGIEGVKVPQQHAIAKKYADDWRGLFRFWGEQVTALGENFAAGDARVDPKQLLRTCERCDLKSLCRVHERLGALDEGEEFAESSREDDEEAE